MGREADIASVSHKYQARSHDREKPMDGGREELHNQAKSLRAYEEDLTHTVGTTFENGCEIIRENMEEAKGQVLKLARELD
ncbi:hypothetical protein H5410_036268 [Solanum commersonii]|uniref:Uncharacterized protein n=1 Tax=Solanum commersonii TaxID=4109 RepID=A0A9J5Y707_SOLCO|nr:hypothetical protein H5410_036268 [Solanum commersonii]